MTGGSCSSLISPRRFPASGRRRIAFSAVVLVCAGVIAGCGSSTPSKGKTYLDIPRVERAIRRSILAQRGLQSTVVCPTRVLQKPGKFACVATTHSRKKPYKAIKTPFVVTIHNSKGYVTYIGK